VTRAVLPAPPQAAPSRAPSGLLVWAALWTVYIVWGSTYLALRVLVETIPPLLSTGTRFLLAGSLMLGVLALRRRAIRVTRAELLSSLLVGSLMMGAVATVATAEQDGVIVAALAGGRAIADPFRPTADLLALLRLHAEGAGVAARSRSRVRAPRLRAA